MTLQFPASPSLNQTFTASNNLIYKWDGEKWITTGSAQAQGDYVSKTGDNMTGDLTLGTNKVTLDAGDGSASFAGNIGFGTTSPVFSNGDGLEIQRDGTACLRIHDNTNSKAGEIFADSTGLNIDARGIGAILNFDIEGSTKATLDNAGNITATGSATFKAPTANGVEVQTVGGNEGTKFPFVGKNTSGTTTFNVNGDGKIQSGNNYTDGNGVNIFAGGSIYIRQDGATGGVLRIRDGSDYKTELKGDGAASFAGGAFAVDSNGTISTNINTAGIVKLSSTNDFNSPKIKLNSVDGSASFRDIETYNPTVSSSGDLYRGYSDVNGTNSLQFSVTSAGLVQARTGTINVIGSERRIKEEINPVDAAVSWETIKNTPYYSYRFIGSDFISYGPIVDEVPSEMVMEGMTSDETGNIRTYDNGMLQARLYTALQTALTRIEALEAKITSLSEEEA